MSVERKSEIQRVPKLTLISPSGHVTVSSPEADLQSQDCLDSMATKAPRELSQLPPIFSSEIQNAESCHGITTLKLLLQSLHCV